MTADYDTDQHNYGTENEYQLSYFFSLFSSLLLLCILIGHRVTHTWKISILPEAGATLLVGALVGLLCKLRSDAITKALVGFDPSLFFISFLPPIIFNSGYSMKRRFFFQNIVSILSFAILGTLISTFVIGGMLVTLGNYGLTVKVSLAEALAFGSLISATDPVSTLAVFQELRVDPLLFYLVFGESVLNDAVSIVLFGTFSKFVGYSHTLGSILIAALDFVLIFVGSTAIGVFIGCSSALLLKYFRFRQQLAHEIGVVALFAYLPFLVSEACQMSGIVSVLFAGITMKHYTHNNLSTEAQVACRQIFHTLAFMAETAVFLNLGMSSVAMGIGYNPGFIAWSLLACILGRALHVYPISCLLNCRRQEKIQTKQQHMLCFSGLRGAIAFALSLSFPGKRRDIIVSSTMCIVIVTVFVFGGATVKVLGLLKISRLSKEEERELDIRTRPDRSMQILQFDAQYLVPFFTRQIPVRFYREEQLEQDLQICEKTIDTEVL